MFGSMGFTVLANFLNNRILNHLISPSSSREQVCGDKPSGLKHHPPQSYRLRTTIHPRGRLIHGFLVLALTATFPLVLATKATVWVWAD